MKNWKIIPAAMCAMTSLCVLLIAAAFSPTDPRVLLPAFMISFVLTLLSLAFAQDSGRDNPRSGLDQEKK